MHAVERVSRANIFVAALLAMSMAIPAAAETNTRLSAVRIDNFGQVSANYYRGAQPEGRDYADLAAFGVKTVIDLQQDFDVREAGLVKNAGMNFYRIPMTTRRPPTTEQQAEFLKIVNDPANQPVYVHCAGGRHRTGVMTAVYRITDEGWTADRAFKEMKQYKFGADFLHPEFKQFVYGYRAPTVQLATASKPATAPGTTAAAAPVVAMAVKTTN
jgi:tyrosine-protein phosphatase SIW14